MAKKLIKKNILYFLFAMMVISNQKTVAVDSIQPGANSADAQLAKKGNMTNLLIAFCLIDPVKIIKTITEASIIGSKGRGEAEADKSGKTVFKDKDDEKVFKATKSIERVQAKKTDDPNFYNMSNIFSDLSCKELNDSGSFEALKTISDIPDKDWSSEAFPVQLIEFIPKNKKKILTLDEEKETDQTDQTKIDTIVKQHTKEIANTIRDVLLPDTRKKLLKKIKEITDNNRFMYLLQSVHKGIFETKLLEIKKSIEGVTDFNDDGRRKIVDAIGYFTTVLTDIEKDLTKARDEIVSNLSKDDMAEFFWHYLKEQWYFSKEKLISERLSEQIAQIRKKGGPLNANTLMGGVTASSIIWPTIKLANIYPGTPSYNSVAGKLFDSQEFGLYAEKNGIKKIKLKKVDATGQPLEDWNVGTPIVELPASAITWLGNALAKNALEGGEADQSSKTPLSASIARASRPLKVLLFENTDYFRHPDFFTKIQIAAIDAEKKINEIEKKLEKDGTIGKAEKCGKILEALPFYKNINKLLSAEEVAISYYGESVTSLFKMCRIVALMKNGEDREYYTKIRLEDMIGKIKAIDPNTLRGSNKDLQKKVGLFLEGIEKNIGTLSVYDLIEVESKNEKERMQDKQKELLKKLQENADRLKHLSLGGLTGDNLSQEDSTAIKTEALEAGLLKTNREIRNELIELHYICNNYNTILSNTAQSMRNLCSENVDANDAQKNNFKIDLDSVDFSRLGVLSSSGSVIKGSSPVEKFDSAIGGNSSSLTKTSAKPSESNSTSKDALEKLIKDLSSIGSFENVPRDADLDVRNITTNTYDLKSMIEKIKFVFDNIEKIETTTFSKKSTKTAVESVQKYFDKYKTHIEDKDWQQAKSSLTLMKPVLQNLAGMKGTIETLELSAKSRDTLNGLGAPTESENKHVPEKDDNSQMKLASVFKTTGSTIGKAPTIVTSNDDPNTIRFSTVKRNLEKIKKTIRLHSYLAQELSSYIPTIDYSIKNFDLLDLQTRDPNTGKNRIVRWTTDVENYLVVYADREQNDDSGAMNRAFMNIKNDLSLLSEFVGADVEFKANEVSHSSDSKNEVSHSSDSEIEREETKSAVTGGGENSKTKESADRLESAVESNAQSGTPQQNQNNNNQNNGSMSSVPMPATVTSHQITGYLSYEQFQKILSTVKTQAQKEQVLNVLAPFFIQLTSEQIQQLDANIKKNTLQQGVEQNPINQQNQVGSNSVVSQQNQQVDAQGVEKTMTAKQFLDNLRNENSVVIAAKKSISDIKTVSAVKKSKNELANLIKRINPLFKPMPTKKPNKATVDRRKTQQNQWVNSVNTWLNELNQSDAAAPAISVTEELVTLTSSERNAINHTLSALVKDLDQQSKAIIKADRDKNLAEKEQMQDKRTVSAFLDNLRDENDVVIAAKKSISDIKTVSAVKKSKNELTNLIKRINPLFKPMPTKKPNKATVDRRKTQQNQWVNSVNTWLNELNQSDAAAPAISVTEELVTLKSSELNAINHTLSALVKDLDQQSKTIIKADRDKKREEERANRQANQLEQKEESGVELGKKRLNPVTVG